jgi:hypothetical protein
MIQYTIYESVNGAKDRTVVPTYFAYKSVSEEDRRSSASACVSGCGLWHENPFSIRLLATHVVWTTYAISLAVRRPRRCNFGSDDVITVTDKVVHTSYLIFSQGNRVARSKLTCREVDSGGSVVRCTKRLAQFPELRYIGSASGGVRSGYCG